MKNEIVTVTAEGLGTHGEGIARHGGLTLFVPYLLPGERARVRILKVKDGVGYAKAEEILIPAEERVRPICPVFYRCGGCQLQHLRYRDQLKFKTGLVEGAFRKIAGLNVKALPCERSDRDYGYRNKLQLPVGRQDGKNVVGFFAERTHRIVATESCPIHPAWSKDLIAALLGFMEKCGLDGYDPETGSGHIRHIVVRELKNRYIVTLVATQDSFTGIDYFIYLLREIFREFALYINVNRDSSNVVFGKEFVHVCGPETYECTEAGIVYEAGPNTFVQVNDGIRSKLYENVVSLMEEDETVIDCYAGGGLLTAMLAKKCAYACGVEVVPEASRCADRLREANGLSEKMENICGTVEEALPALLDRFPGAAVVLDPPRAGAERSVLRELLARGVKKIVLVSCNPATLARDVGILTGALAEGAEGLEKREGELGYEVALVRPFDMFPQTKHVETLVQLNKRPLSGKEE